MMRVKLFTRGKGKNPHTRFDELEADINAWLQSNPKIEVAFAHRLSQPSFGWGELAIAIWYHELS